MTEPLVSITSGTVAVGPGSYFNTVGYLRVAELLGHGDVMRLRRVATHAAVNSDDPRVRRTPEKIRVDQVVSFDPACLDVATSGPVVEMLAPFLGPNIELVENRHNHLSVYLAPGNDRLHRDVLQWSRSILTVLFTCPTAPTSTRQPVSSPVAISGRVSAIRTMAGPG